MLAVDFGYFDDRNIEGAAAEVIDHDLGVTAAPIHTVGEGSGGRLVDDALDLKAGDPARVLGRLALRVIEIRRHCDDRFGHCLAKVILGRLLHFHQHAGRHLRRRHLLAVNLDPGVAIVGLGNGIRHHATVFLHDVVGKLSTDQTLDCIQRVLGIGHRLALGSLSDQHLIITSERDDRRSSAPAFAVLDDLRLARLEYRDAGIGRAQIDSDDLAHICLCT